MEVKATAKGLRTSPQKMRRIVDSVRGKRAEEAITILNFMPSPNAKAVSKVVKSAVANAENNFQMAPSDLKIIRAYVGEGAMMKRMRYKGRGRVSPILKRMCHVTIVVEETV